MISVKVITTLKLRNECKVDKLLKRFIDIVYATWSSLESLVDHVTRQECELWTRWKYVEMNPTWGQDIIEYFI